MLLGATVKNSGSRAPNPDASGCRSIREALILGSMLCLMMLATGCATPKVQQSDPHLLLKTGLLSFLQEGVTTREETVLNLGFPSMQMEGERILMYQLRADSDGKWYLTSPQWDAGTGLRSWKEGTSSLVLVFGKDGVLNRCSLVTTQ
ncbi:MAG TPA: hypothetical protein ENN79_00535 [Desulfobacteraceae bacterium]|nr:hypothetical protein [Desulfobacteraceae bacterium]